MTDPHRELRDNLSNIDPAWQGEIKALLDDRDHLLRVLQVEKGVASAAVEGWDHRQGYAEMWVWNGPFTHNVQPVIVRKSARVWELRQHLGTGAMSLTFPTALEAMLADPPWTALEDGETQEVTLW